MLCSTSCIGDSPFVKSTPIPGKAALWQLKTSGIPRLFARKIFFCCFFFATAFQRLRIAVLNPADLYETETAFVLKADLPGVKPEEVSVTVEENELGRFI